MDLVAHAIAQSAVTFRADSHDDTPLPLHENRWTCGTGNMGPMRAAAKSDGGRNHIKSLRESRFIRVASGGRFATDVRDREGWSAMDGLANNQVLGEAKQFARDLEEAYCGIWKNWCAGR